MILKKKEGKIEEEKRKKKNSINDFSPNDSLHMVIFQVPIS